jgi:N-methylhydantoinase A
MTLGIDVGGTFTDLVLLDEQGGLSLGKVPSTPSDQAVGIMAGLRALAPEPRRLLRIAHGTTVSTNAMLQGTGGPVGLMTTPGFRDALEIGRTRRMLPSLYDPAFVRPPPMVPRPLRCEVPERLNADGSALIPLDVGAVRRVAAQLAGHVRAIAVCFLHSWNNDAHERRAEQVLRAALPDVYLTISADVIPEFREYERFSTTAINAFLLPVMDRYLASLDGALQREGCAGKLMSSDSRRTRFR